MIKSIYNSIREDIFFRIQNFHTNINTKDRAELSDYFSNLLSNKILEGNKVFSEINSTNILKMEQQNKIIVDILTEIKDNTKKLLTEFEYQGLVYYETDPKSKKQILKARSIVLKSTIEYINKLKNIEYEYYTKFHKLD